MPVTRAAKKQLKQKPLPSVERELVEHLEKNHPPMEWKGPDHQMTEFAFAAGQRDIIKKLRKLMRT